MRYGEHPDQQADIRLPDPPGGPGQSRPLVIFIHGGFWSAEYDRAHVGPLAADLAAKGYPVATVEYRRIGQPGGGWPGTFSDIAAAAVAVPDLLAKEVAHRRGRRGAGAGVDRPVLAGHSAGGHLALWYAALAPDAVRGVLALAPVADLRLACHLRLGDDATRALLGGGPDEVPDRYAAADPAALLPSGVRTVIVHGVDDDLVPIEVSRQYARAAELAGDDTALVELAGVEHFAVIDPLSRAWPVVLDALGALST